MTRIQKLAGIGALAVAFSSGTLSAATAVKPNIIVILADDLGYSDTEPFGGEIQTPNISSLAKEGIRFTQFYNCAKCSPSRASLLTGLYPQQVGMTALPKPKRANSGEKRDPNDEGGEGDLSRNALTLAELLKTAGYSTYLSGKWHLTTQQAPTTTDAEKYCWPLQRGFDHFFGIIGAMVPSYFNSKNLIQDNAFLSEDQLPKEFYVTDLLAERACGYIDDHVKKTPDKPFFLYAAFNAPHGPVMAKPEDAARYKGKYAVGWDQIRRERFARQTQLGLFPPTAELSARNEQVPAWDSLDSKKKLEVQEVMEQYAGMITCLDQGVGRIMETLHKNHLIDNTLVIFLSDNGAAIEGESKYIPGKGGHIGRWWANAANTPLRYFKTFTWEGGCCTQMIVHWPKAQAPALTGGISHEVGHVVDLMPTCVELSGATYPREYQGRTIQPMEGKSLVPAIEGKSLGERELFWQHGGHDSARVGDWKMDRLTSRKPWELYNMKVDPSEVHDLAASKPEMVKALEAKWNAWADRVHADAGSKSETKDKKTGGKQKEN